MGKTLVVVESPTKVKTLQKYLGRNYTIKASVGHVMDLPKSKLGIEIGNRFEPVYEVIKGKKKVLDEINQAAKKVEEVFLAPDPDREGEAIAWHIAGEIRKTTKKKPPKIRRVLIDEITKSGVSRALKSPIDLNQARYNSQQARRILDRLVGYQISPLLWDKVRRGLSAGRVQSVALRIICEREREVRAFTPVEYWSVDVAVKAKKPPPFLISLLKRAGKKIAINNEAEAKAIKAELRKHDFIIAGVQKKERKRSPAAPFTTSKLQQDASRKLGFTAKKTMMLAQQLYEGVELGDEGAAGLITYMRTDSTRLSNEAIEHARTHIKEAFGASFLPKEPRLYKVGKRAQDAHEAIRPTMIHQPPGNVKKFLKRDQFRLYKLVWDRFVACQMKDARFDQTSIDVQAGDLEFRATGSVLRFEGFMKAYVEGEDDKVPSDEKAVQLPEVEKGERLESKEVMLNQHFTKPPPRFTEASLVKELEEDGIGRPSTYASILSTLQDRKYAEKVQNRFEPTELGLLINDLLVEHFPAIMDVEFTAQMEAQLDEVEEGATDWQEILRKFYDPFSKSLKQAKKKMRNVKREEVPTEHKCEKCGKVMVIKWGRHGHFLACSGYPDCKSTKEFKRAEGGKIEIVEQQDTGEVCEECKSPMVVKNGRFGRFLACSKYPDCKHTRSISTGVPCAEKSCDGQIVERRSRRGRIFYGCSRYPKCKHALWNKPVKKGCPQCNLPYLVEKHTKSEGSMLVCNDKECGYKEPLEESAA